MWSSFLDTSWDPCSGKFPEIIHSKPHCFPSSAHFKLCDTLLLPAIDLPHSPGKPASSLPLLRRGLINHSPCTALDGNNPLTEVLDSDYRAENQPDVGASADAIFPLQAHVISSSKVSSWWGWERRVCCPDVSPATGSSLSELDVQSVTEMG